MARQWFDDDFDDDDAPVPWTKPAELELPAAGAPTLGQHFGGGANVIFADGLVRFVKAKEIDPMNLRSLMTANGGEGFKLP